MSSSCVYEGWVRHRRVGDQRHEVRARLFMCYLDLEEMPGVFDGYGRLASARSGALARFRREDHLGDPRRPLASVVRELVAGHTGAEPAGPIRLLTNLRYLGHCFNPVSFYYCFDTAGRRVEAVVAEVTNTPWGERHAYVLAPDCAGAPLRGRFDKQFHVSPFMGMDHEYVWQLTEPGEQITVHIDSERAGARVFDATLSLRRRELSRANVARMLVRHPLLTRRIVGQIYRHGLALRLKGARYFPNPSGAPLLGAARRAHARASRERAAP